MTRARRLASDPFLQHVPMPRRAVMNVLGVPVVFESNALWLMRLAEQAYATLPACDATTQTNLRVRLLANEDGMRSMAHPPKPHVYTDGKMITAIASPADMAICVPEQGKALVTVSPAMRTASYHVRYELIEFICYRLVSHHLDAVGLHAACIAKNGQAWLIFGESGAGKSTLTLACIQCGWNLIAEDSAFVLPDVHPTVRGVPTFVHVLDDTLRFFSKTQLKSKRITRRSGVSKLEIDVPANGRHFGEICVCAPLAGAIFLRPRRTKERPRFNTLTATQLASRLTQSQPFGPSYRRWPQVLSLVMNLPGYALSQGNDPWQAVGELERLIGQ